MVYSLVCVARESHQKPCPWRPLKTALEASGSFLEAWTGHGISACFVFWYVSLGLLSKPYTFAVDRLKHLSRLPLLSFSLFSVQFSFLLLHFLFCYLLLGWVQQTLQSFRPAPRKVVEAPMACGKLLLSSTISCRPCSSVSSLNVHAPPVALQGSTATCAQHTLSGWYLRKAVIPTYACKTLPCH